MFFEPTTSSWYALEPRTNPGSKEAREEGGTRGGHGGESAPAGGRHWRACCSPQTKSQMLPKKTQALSLEGLMRVAKELRDLVEKPEDGIWVSCSRREGKACRFENREEREKLLFNSRPRFSSAAAVADNKLSLSQPLLPLFLQKKQKRSSSTRPISATSRPSTTVQVSFW